MQTLYFIHDVYYSNSHANPLFYTGWTKVIIIKLMCCFCFRMTSFVIRCFQQAKPHIQIDQNIINRAVTFILKQKQTNGRFKVNFFSQISSLVTQFVKFFSLLFEVTKPLARLDTIFSTPIQRHFCSTYTSKVLPQYCGDNWETAWIACVKEIYRERRFIHTTWPQSVTVILINLLGWYIPFKSPRLLFYPYNPTLAIHSTRNNL